LAERQIEILNRAQQLASSLASGSVVVQRNVFLSLVADFMGEPEPDINRLQRMLNLIQQGSGGHLKRGGGYGQQLRAATEELARLLSERDFSPVELKSVFGWTGRLLLIRNLSSGAPVVRKSDSHLPSRKPGEGSAAHVSRSGSPGQGSALGGVGGAGLEALLKLRDRLKEQEGNGKK
jgi:hypothetical protein